MAQKKDLEYYLVQARRIAAHREEGAEEEIRKEFNKLRKELNAYIAEVHEKYAKGDGSLSFADLQKAGYDARFLEEIEKRINVATPRVAKKVHQLVNDTYEYAYKSMVEGVEKVMEGADLDEVFKDAKSISPQQIKAAVSSPFMENALMKNHQSIVYDIRQAVAVGLMNGDRYNTIAQKITDALSKETGPYKNAILIARTETHRVREAGNHDAGLMVDEELQKGTTGMRMTKTWRTMKDERVRPQYVRKRKKGGWVKGINKKAANHMILNEQTVLENEPFDLKDGNTAMMPGSSGVAGHDCNCRCYASREMMTDEEFFKKTGKHFPGWGEKPEIKTSIERFDDYNAKDEDGNPIYENPEGIKERWNDVDKRYKQLVDKYGLEPDICGDMALINAKEWDLAFEENLSKYMKDNPDVRKSTAVRRVKKTMYERPTGKSYDIFQCGECYDNNFWDLEKGKKVSAILMNSRSSGFEMTFDEAIEYRQNKLKKYAERAAKGRRARGLSGVLEGAEGTFIHEYGHLIDHKYHISSSPKFQALWKSLDEEEITLGLSSYAATNEKELLAEAFLESFLPDQRDISKRVMAIVEEMIQ